MGEGVGMATRYLVSWVHDRAGQQEKGFAFRPGAVALWFDLVNAESSGQLGISCPALAYLGPNGERSRELEVSSTFSKVVGDGVKSHIG